MREMLVAAMFEDPLSTDAEPASHPASSRGRDRGGRRAPAPSPLSSAPPGSPGSTSTRRRSSARRRSPSASAGTRSTSRTSCRKRQRPKVDDYADEGYLFAVLHFPVYDRAIQRLNAAELDVFVGPDYLVTLPTTELKPVTRLFHRCEEDDAFREQLFSKGSGRLLYEILDDLFDYCFPILDKIGHKLDSLEDDVFEGRSDEVVRDLSNVKQEIISYRKIIKPERSTLRLLERHVERFLPEELELYFDDIVDAAERIWDIARQLQGGRRGARGHERVGDRAPPERRAARPHGVRRDRAAADADHRHLRDERPLPRLRHGLGVLDDRRRRWSSRSSALLGFFRYKRWL